MFLEKHISEIENLLGNPPDQEKSFSFLLALFKTELSFNSASLFLYDADNGALDLRLTLGDYLVEMGGEGMFPLDGGMSGFISRQKNPVIFQTVTKRTPDLQDRFNSFLALPLNMGEKKLGVLNLGHGEPEFYTRREIEKYKVLGFEFSLMVDRILTAGEPARQQSAGPGKSRELRRLQADPPDEGEPSASSPASENILEKIAPHVAEIIRYSDVLPLMIETRNQRKAKHAVTVVSREAARIRSLIEEHYTDDTP